MNYYGQEFPEEEMSNPPDFDAQLSDNKQQLDAAIQVLEDLRVQFLNKAAGLVQTAWFTEAFRVTVEVEPEVTNKLSDYAAVRNDIDSFCCQALEVVTATVAGSDVWWHLDVFNTNRDSFDYQTNGHHYHGYPRRGPACLTKPVNQAVGKIVEVLRKHGYACAATPKQPGDNEHFAFSSWPPELEAISTSYHTQMLRTKGVLNTYRKIQHDQERDQAKRLWWAHTLNNSSKLNQPAK